MKTINQTLAVTRLTALWSLSESGLGGVMHALKLPFTGAVAGGMAVILITLIAHFSNSNAKTLFTSLMVVLITKAMVSPHSPFAAYFAVSIQGLLGLAVYRIFGIRLVSILLFSLLAMWESAFQKLLMLTLFFGEAFWEALDEMMAYMAKQTGLELMHGSAWVAGMYVGIYTVTAFLVTALANKILNQIKSNTFDLPVYQPTPDRPEQQKKARRRNKFIKYVIVILAIAAVLFFVNPDQEEAWQKVIRTLAWSIGSIVLWFGLINPLLVRLTTSFLKTRQTKYSEEISQTLQLIPELRSLSIQAWQQSEGKKGFEKLSYFLVLLIYWSLIWQEPEA